MSINEASQVECWGQYHIAGGQNDRGTPWVIDIGGPAHYVATSDSARALLVLMEQSIAGA